MRMSAFAAVAVASLALTVTPAHHHPVLCAHSGRLPCLAPTLERPGRHAGLWLTNTPARGLRLEITPQGHVTARWPFRHSPALDHVLRGHRLWQLRIAGTRWCAGAVADGAVAMMRCTAWSMWVTGWLAPHTWVSVRASDAAGLPCALAVVPHDPHPYALTLNGRAMGLQEWRRR